MTKNLASRDRHPSGSSSTASSDSVPLSPPSSLTAFAGFNQVISGNRADVVAKLRVMNIPQGVLVRSFDDATGDRIELDLRPEATNDAGSTSPESAEVAAPRSVGRPKLGVVAREVTLLPRHWEWLNRQPGGASVALRKLVDEARRANAGRETARTSREAAYRFMTEIAGDLPGFEEATRALFASNQERFESLIEDWPEDVNQYLRKLAALSWSTDGE